MNDKYVNFNHGMEGMENLGKQESAKETAIQNCLLHGENLMLGMLRKICGQSDTFGYAEFSHMFEAWKEERENL